MKIVNFIPDSFQEFKPNWQLVLFCKGCNLCCDGCYNYKTIMDDNIYVYSAIELIDKYKTKGIDSVVFLGGEPTLYYDLPELMEHCHSNNLKTKVYTNGQHPEVIKKLCDNSFIDECSIDFKIYSPKNIKHILPKNRRNEYDETYCKKTTRYVDNIVECGTILNNHNIKFEFRTTIFDYNRSDVPLIENYIKSVFPNVEHILQKDFNENVRRNK